MKKYVLGAAIIIAALLTALLIPWLDGKEETKPDIPAAVDGVKAGIEAMRDGTRIVPEGGQK